MCQSGLPSYWQTLLTKTKIFCEIDVPNIWNIMNITQLCTTWGKLLMAFIEHKIYSEHSVTWQTREKTFALSKSFSSLVFRDLGLSAMPELICKKVCHCWEISTLLLITVGQTKTRCYHLILMTIKTFLMRLFKLHFGYHLMSDLIKVLFKVLTKIPSCCSSSRDVERLGDFSSAFIKILYLFI